MDPTNAYLLGLDADREQRRRDAEEFTPLPSIATLRQDIDAIVPSVISALRADPYVSRLNYNSIRPEQIECAGERTAAWVLVANEALGVGTHVYLTLEHGLRSFPHEVNTRSWVFGKWRRHEDSTSFEEYVASIASRSDHLQKELSEVLRLLREICPSIAEYHRSTVFFAESGALAAARAQDAEDAKPRLQAAREQRRRRGRSSSSPSS